MADTLIETLISEQGTLYSEEMGADIGRDTPQELFHWLVGSIMLSARISSSNAVRGAAALRSAGLHRIDAIEAADRTELVRVLNENGYARYDESTADYIRDTASWAKRDWGGDLRRLRDAGGGSDAVLRRLQGAKGLGPLGARIFAREAQLSWAVLYPMLDGPAVDQAESYGLPTDAGALAEAAGGAERFVRVLAALTRVALDGPTEAVDRASG